MDRNTKDLVYTLLDILDVFQKSNSFMSIDISTISNAKSDLFSLINSSLKDDNTTVELIGVIPSLLIDKSKFPSNLDIIKFAEKTLNITVPHWEKKKREEIIGRIVYVIAEKKPNELNKFVNPWQQFNNLKINEHNRSNMKVSFVDTWLEFFENYNNARSNH